MTTRRQGFIVVVAALAVCWAGTTALTAAPPPAIPVDDDHDGINDALEQRLAELYAPVIYIEPDESNYPVNVDWFLARARLQYHEDCASDVDDDFGPNPIGSQLLGPNSGAVWAAGPHCGSDDTGYGHPPHRLLTTVAADPDGQYSVGSRTTGYSDQQTFVLTDLPDSERVGSTDPRDWVTYFHAYPSADGGVMIQYWHVFAYNQFGGGFDNHGGDWDASIQVQLDKNLNLVGVWFSRHADDHPGTFFTVDQVRMFDNTHPVVAIDGGGHAAFRSPEDWATCNCRVGESVTGPIGTIVWTLDSDPFDDPSKLRKAGFDLLDCATFNCSLTLSDPSGGVVWKTWTDGGVVASGHLTHSISAPSEHGGLVNLGEYNPCTSSTCFGSAQASSLLAGEFQPLNDQFWLRYEGRWGSIGTINSGPRGPVFQGFEDRGEGDTSVYTAWYNQGAHRPATNDGNHPWLVPPTTAAALQGPTYTAGGVTYVSGTTHINLSGSQSSIASRFGTVATYDRFHPVGDVLPSFSSYTGPFGLARPFPLASFDGDYTVEYFSIDGLGNVEATHTLALTLDTMPPMVSINQPTATSYPHSMTLTLDYAASDSGSGLQSITPTLDGAMTLNGHGLSSGQAINLLTELSVGTHTFTIDAADNVGNSGFRSVTFEIIVTSDSIKNDVSQFLEAGMIKNNGLAISLSAKLNGAANARARGDCQTAASIYRAFINELQAQLATGVNSSAAQIMIGDAEYLIAHCP